MSLPEPRDVLRARYARGLTSLSKVESSYKLYFALSVLGSIIGSIVGVAFYRDEYTVADWWITVVGVGSTTIAVCAFARGCLDSKSDAAMAKRFVPAPVRVQEGLRSSIAPIARALAINEQSIRYFVDDKALGVNMHVRSLREGEAIVASLGYLREVRVNSM